MYEDEDRLLKPRIRTGKPGSQTFKESFLGGKKHWGFTFAGLNLKKYSGQITGKRKVLGPWFFPRVQPGPAIFGFLFPKHSGFPTPNWV